MSVINENLEAFNLNTSSRTRLVQSMNEIHEGELESIVKSMANSDLTIPHHDNNRVNTLTLRYAVVTAFENGQDRISDADMQSAYDRALDFASKNGTLNVSNLDAITIEGENAAEGAEQAGKRKRNPNLYPSIKRMVEASPDAEKSEIVEQAVERFAADEGTATNYFYKARKELGLKNNGRRGRKGSGIYGKMVELINENTALVRDEIVALAVERGIKEGTANAYYSKIINS